MTTIIEYYPIAPIKYPKEQSVARQEAEKKAQKFADKLRELNIDPDSL